MKHIQFPLVHGVDTSGASKSASEPGKIRVAKNLRIKKGGKDSLSMRHYSNSIAQLEPAAVTTGRVFAAGGKFHHISSRKTRVLGYGETSWETTSRVGATVSVLQNTDVTDVDVIGGNTLGAYGDSCSALAVNSIGDELRVVGGMVGNNSSGTPQFQTMFQAVINGRKRAMVALQTAATAPTSHWRCVHVFPVSTTGFVIVRGLPSGNTVELVHYDIATDALGTATTISNVVLLDAQLTAGGDIAVLVRDVVTGYPFLRRHNLSATPTNISNTQVHATGPVNPKHGGLSATLPANNMHIVLSQYDADSNTVRMYRIDTSTLAVTAGGTLADPIGGSHATMTVCRKNITDQSWCYVAGIDGGLGRLLSVTNAAVTATAYTPRFWPSTKLLLPAATSEVTTPYPWIVGTLGSQCGVWALSNTVPACVAMHSGTRGTYQGAATPGYASNGTLYSASNDAKFILPTTSGHEVVTIGLSSIRGIPAEHSGLAVLPLGYSRYWDGERWAPSGFHQPPVAAVATSAGGSLTAGSYSVAFVWEWTDAKGLRQQSAASVYTVVATASQKLDITLSQYSIPTDERVLMAPGAPYVVEYRSAAGGSTLTRVKEIPLPATLWSAATWTATDTLSDSAISAKEILYTSGGGNELGSFGLDACDFAVGISDRIIWHSPTYPEKLFYSKSLRPGRPFEFNPALSFDLPEAIVAVTQQDGNVYACATNNIYVFAPSFANDDGTTGRASSGVVDAINVGQGIGVKSRASVIVAPTGVFFESVRGMHMIPRGGGPPQYIGIQLEGFALSDARTAVHNQGMSELAWCFNTGLSGPGTQNIFVFNYLHGQWFNWTLYEGSATTFTAGAFINPQNGFYYFSDVSLTLARLEYESYGTDTSSAAFVASAPVEVKIETADFALHDFGGRTRVNRVLLDADSGISSPSITIEESIDQGATWVNSVSCALGTPNEPVVYQVQNRKNTGIRFRFRSTDSSIATNYYGLTIDAKPLGKPQLPAANRKG